MSNRQLAVIIVAMVASQALVAIYVGACLMDVRQTLSSIRGDMNMGIIELPRRLNEAK